jgi:hypothetical protein
MKTEGNSGRSSSAKYVNDVTYSGYYVMIMIPEERPL